MKTDKYELAYNNGADWKKARIDVLLKELSDQFECKAKQSNAIVLMAEARGGLKAIREALEVIEKDHANTH